MSREYTRGSVIEMFSLEVFLLADVLRIGRQAFLGFSFASVTTIWKTGWCA